MDKLTSEMFYCERYKSTLSLKNCIYYFKNVNPKTKMVMVNDFANRRSYTIERWNCVDCPQGKENSKKMEDNRPETEGTRAAQSHIEPNKRVCAKCGETKPITEFWKKKGNKDGLDTQCRDCIRKYNNEWYAKKHGIPISDKPPKIGRPKKTPAAEVEKMERSLPLPNRSSFVSGSYPPVSLPESDLSTTTVPTTVPIPDFEYRMMKFFADKTATPVDEFMITVIRAGILTILEERYESCK